MKKQKIKPGDILNISGGPFRGIAIKYEPKTKLDVIKVKPRRTSVAASVQEAMPDREVRSQKSE
jgi:hypothetical protein